MGGWGYIDPSDAICTLLLPQGSDHPALYLETGFTHLETMAPILALLNYIRDTGPFVSYSNMVKF